MSYSSGTFLAAMSGKSVCQGWDALVAYERGPLNDLFAQQYVANLGLGGTFSIGSLSGSVTITGTTYVYQGLQLGAPEISFPPASTGQNVQVTMNVLAGTIAVVGSTLSGNIVKSLQLLPVDQYQLQMAIPLSNVAGQVGPNNQNGATVNLDLRTAESFTTNLLDGAPGEQLGTAIGTAFVSLPANAAIYQAGSVVYSSSGLVPTSFTITTQSPPPGGSGGSVVLAVATAYNTAGGQPPPLAHPYLIPDGYGACVVVANPTYVRNILQPQYAANLPGGPSVTSASNGQGLLTLSFNGSASIGKIQGNAGIDHWRSGTLAQWESVTIPYTGLTVAAGGAPGYPLAVNWNGGAPVEFYVVYGGHDQGAETSTTMNITAQISVGFSVSGTTITLSDSGSPSLSFQEPGFPKDLGVGGQVLAQVSTAMQPMASQMTNIQISPVNEFALTHLLFPTQNVLQFVKAAMPGDLVALSNIVGGSDAFTLSPLQIALAPGQSGTFTLTAPSSAQPVTWAVNKPTVAKITASSNSSATIAVSSKFAGTMAMTVIVSATGTGTGSSVPVTTAAINVIPSALQITPAFALTTGATQPTFAISTILSSPSVTWTMSPNDGAGTLTANGLTATFTPPTPLPSSPVTLVTIHASANASGDTFSAEAVVALFNAYFAKVTPNLVTLAPQGQQLFTVTATRGTPTFTWSCLPQSAGSITSGGTFTALSATLPVTVVCAESAGGGVAGIGIVINASSQETDGAIPMTTGTTPTAAPMANGSLVKLSTSNTVYLVIMGQACGIPDPTTATNLFGVNWNDLVTTVTQTQFNQVQPGPPLSSGACLVQVQTPENPSGQGNAQYVYTWGQILGITPEVYLSYPFQYGTLNGITPVMLNAIPQGFDITS